MSTIVSIIVSGSKQLQKRFIMFYGVPKRRNSTTFIQKKKLSDPKIKPENFIIVLDYASKILDFPINTTYYFTESNMPA